MSNSYQRAHEPDRNCLSFFGWTVQEIFEQAQVALSGCCSEEKAQCPIDSDVPTGDITTGDDYTTGDLTTGDDSTTGDIEGTTGDESTTGVTTSGTFLFNLYIYIYYQ